MKVSQELMLFVAMTAWTIVRISGCPTYCECDEYTKMVTCSRLPVTTLQQISADIPADTSVLEITGGMFYSLRDTDFVQMPTKQLLELRITHSQLQEVYNQAFTKLTTLKILKLNNNQISSIQPNAFLGLSNLRVLDLSNNNLQHISNKDLFKPLYYLQDIDLSNNNINDIPNGLFSSQTNLQELKMAGNKNIGNLRGPSFQGLRSIRKFLFSGCSIRTLENDLFAAINSISTLDLSYNQIQSLPNTDSFRLLQNLRNLTLQGNRITALNDRQFSGMDLNSLDLSKNSISSISSNTFMYLVGVRYLDMSGNKIHNLPEYVFQPISSEVYTLKLNDNRALITLPSNIFSGMQKLQNLNLSSCAIQSLGEEHFQQVFSLRQVDISNNWLKQLPQSFIDKASSMQCMKLNNNPWNCDCNIRPLHTWLQYQRISSTMSCIDGNSADFKAYSPSPKCSTPQSLANRDISMLSPNDLEHCEHMGSGSSVPISIIAGVLGGLVAVAILTVIITCCLYRRHKRGDPLLCYEQPAETKHNERKKNSREPKSKNIRKLKREPKGGRGDRDYYHEKKERRQIDPDNNSLNESDKSFVVRNFFHSMMPDPDGASEGTHSQSMTRKDSVESLSHSGYGYNSRHGSRHSSQYSLNAGYKIESAV